MEYFKCSFQAISNKDIDVKGGAELLGVPMPTLYGRYKEALRDDPLCSKCGYLSSDKSDLARHIYEKHFQKAQKGSSVASRSSNVAPMISDEVPSSSNVAPSSSDVALRIVSTTSLAQKSSHAKTREEHEKNEHRDELYKNRSSWKIKSPRLFSRE